MAAKLRPDHPGAKFSKSGLEKLRFSRQASSPTQRERAPRFSPESPVMGGAYSVREDRGELITLHELAPETVSAFTQKVAVRLGDLDAVAAIRTSRSGVR